MTKHLILVASALLPTTAVLAVNSEANYGLAGPLGGARSRWEAAGVSPFLNYTADGLAVLNGGFRRGESLQGVAEFGFDLDLERIAGWAGTQLHVHGLYLHGDDPSADLVGDFNYLSNIVARGGLRLYQLHLLHESERWSGKMGVVAPDDDFAVSPTSEIFVNSAFGVMPSLSCNSGLAIWPAASLGVWGKVHVAQRTFLQAGIYDGHVPDDYRNRHGTRFDTSSAQGAIALAELAHEWGSVEAPSSGRVGAWWHTGEFADFESGATLDQNHGFHALVEQTLSADGRLRGFARFGYAPRQNRSTVRTHWDAGFTLEGPLPSRSSDVLGLAWFTTRFSESYRAARLTGGAEVTPREAGVEITYAIALRPGLTLQPDFQYIFDAHESGRDAAVAILRVYAEF
jgi:porin